jgi:redox-sensitive bicupin YhaK (pirin superfamily)
MVQILHKSDERGTANYGWLQSRFSFSFADYFNPEKIHFGMLRVLNDDIIAGGGGFGMHPHRNMEIISVPIKGTMLHKDTAGNERAITETDIQVMSAGGGIYHSEFNASETDEIHFLQIWIIPSVTNTKPAYYQRSFPDEEFQNTLRVVAADPALEIEGALPLLQSAKISVGNLAAGNTFTYNPISNEHGTYFFVIDGATTIGGTSLDKRDAIGIARSENAIEISATSDLRLLAIETPYFESKQ